MKEAAKQFTNKTGIAVHVTSGPTAQWSEKVKLDADVIYSGSEAMMSDFENAFSEQIIKRLGRTFIFTPRSHFSTQRKS